MEVTDLKFSMERKLKHKLDLMIKRMSAKSKQDNLVLIDGDEGTGKTNMAAGICYYVSHQTGRPLSIKNLFFNLDNLIDFALKTEEQIIWWDEGALGGLASDWWNKNQKKFMKVLMVARKRRHFFVICIPKFFKLNEYFVIDRSIGLIHTYARKNVNLGRFVYFSKKSKEYLFYSWKKSRLRNYKKYYTFHGSFPEIIGKLKGYPIKEKEYEKEKDRAIMSIGDGTEERKPIQQIESNARAKAFITVKENTDLPITKLAEMFGISRNTAHVWIRTQKEEV